MTLSDELGPFEQSFYDNFFDLSDCTAEKYNLVKNIFTPRCQSFLCVKTGISIYRSWAVAQTLFASMSNLELHYHTPLHVLSILDFAKANNITLTVEQELAIWFHDAIYDPRAMNPQNEQASAMFLDALLNVPQKEQAKKYILATAEYASEETFSDDVSLVMDLDLCAFISPNFPLYDACIAAEFIPLVGKELYAIGRRQFFDKMIAKDRLFRTERFKSFEQVAKDNLIKCRDSL